MPEILVRLRVPLGFCFAAWYLIVAEPASKQMLALCAVLVTLGCALRSWAAGYLFKGKRVAVGGPYAWVRNPLYAGSFLIGAGFCLALWQRPPSISSIVLTTSFVLGFGVIYRTKTLAEEEELRAHLGEPYRAYAQEVPPFLPVKGRVRGLGQQRFSAELYKRNREYECVIGSLVLLTYLYWRYAHA